MELAAVFTRKDSATVSIQTEGATAKHFDNMVSRKDKVNVMILVKNAIQYTVPIKDAVEQVRSVFDIAPAMLSQMSAEDLRAKML